MAPWHYVGDLGGVLPLFAQRQRVTAAPEVEEREPEPADREIPF